MNEQRQDVFRVADEIFRQRPSWVTFFREVLGVDGIVRQVHSSPEALSQFEQTPEYQKIQQMLAKLRENDADLPGGPREPTRSLPFGCRRACTSRYGPRLTTAIPA